MTEICKCRFCRSDAVRVETMPSPYGGAVETFQCLVCRGTTARLAAKVPVYPLPSPMPEPAIAIRGIS
jgi:hypothetical protein